MSIRLRSYQEEAKAAARAALAAVRAVLLVLATGAGKCLGKGTPVLMFDGTIKPVEDVSVGDLLMGPDSHPRRVVSLARGREALYRVTPTKGDAYVVNKSHILSLKRTGTRSAPKYPCERRGGEVVNIEVRDYLSRSATFKHIHKGWRAAVDFPGTIGPLPLPAYILGIWLGDGATGKGIITTGDDEIRAAFSSYAEQLGMAVRVEPNSENSVNLHIKSAGSKYGRGGSPFGNALRHLGVFNDKRIPQQYKTASTGDRLQLLAGIIDTDGHLSANGGYDLTLKSEALLDDVIFVARSLGFACYKAISNKTCGNNGVSGVYWRCHINGAVDRIPCKLPRKQAKPRGQKKDVLVSGITVEPIGEGDYYGFEIEGTDRLFMLGDFTVTHNTVIFSNIAQASAARGFRVLILAHRDTLIKQASRKLAEYGVQHGIIMAGFTPNRVARVQVASVQTLVRRLDKVGQDFDLIVVDEAHLSAAKSYRTIFDRWPKARILGVTGSPCRLDGKGLGVEAGGVFDTLVQGVSIKWLIDEAYLVRPTVYAAEKLVDLSGVKKIGGDYDGQALAEVMDKPKLIGSAIEQYLKICPGVPAVAWCVSVAHAQHVAEQFSAAGVPAVALSGDDDAAARERALAGLGNGTIKVVTFAMLLVEGVDCPAIGAVIMLRPTMSLASYLQVIGRGLRPIFADGMPLDTVADRRAAIAAGPKGDRCFVLDHAGLWVKHGFADEEREWTLEGAPKRPGKRKPNEPVTPAKQCPKCFVVHEPSPACPACGHVYETRKLEAEDGELREITPEMKAVLAAARKKQIQKAKTLEDLRSLGRAFGYSEAWADGTWKAKQKIREQYSKKFQVPIEVYEQDLSQRR